jgi:hypothetical protein
MQRRAFVKGSMAVAGIWALGTAAAHAAPRGARIHAVIYDERYADARRFAAVLGEEGAALLPARSNLVRLWYEAPSRTILANATRIAGLTTQSDAVVARAMAAARGLRVLYEAMHDGRGMAGLTHRFERANGPELARRINNSGAAWAGVVAAEVNAAALACDGAALAARTVGENRSPDFPGTLASWLLGAA